jgi:hypothetical protein
MFVIDEEAEHNDSASQASSCHKISPKDGINTDDIELNMD